jgi:ribosomal protein S18 acetylase RimI-like enzyme
MEVVIRPFRPGDWDGVFLLDRSCFEPPYRLEVPRLRALLQDPSIAVMVIEARDGDETGIVGTLILKHDGQSGRLVLIGIMVDAGFRRVGLGRRLAGWAERIARAHSVGELLAPLEAENEAGAAFLTAVGFMREPGAPPFFDDPAGGHLWRRTLPAAEPAPTAQPHTRQPHTRQPQTPQPQTRQPQTPQPQTPQPQTPPPQTPGPAASAPGEPGGEMDMPPASTAEPQTTEPAASAPCKQGSGTEGPAAKSAAPEPLNVPGSAPSEAAATRRHAAAPKAPAPKPPARPQRKASQRRAAGRGQKRRHR